MYANKPKIADKWAKKYGSEINIKKPKNIFKRTK